MENSSLGSISPRSVSLWVDWARHLSLTMDVAGLRPRQGPGCSPGPDNTMTPVDSPSYSNWPDTGNGTALGHQYDYKCGPNSGHPHGSWQQHEQGTPTQTHAVAGLQTQTWSSAAAHGPRWQYRSPKLAWPPWQHDPGHLHDPTTSLCMDPSDNRSHRHQHRLLQLLQGPGSRLGPWSQLRPDIFYFLIFYLYVCYLRYIQYFLIKNITRNNRLDIPDSPMIEKNQ